LEDTLAYANIGFSTINNFAKLLSLAIPATALILIFSTVSDAYGEMATLGIGDVARHQRNSMAAESSLNLADFTDHKLAPDPTFTQEAAVEDPGNPPGSKERPRLKNSTLVQDIIPEYNFR